jgi:hypothetical protein
MLKHGDITEKVIASFYRVYNELGHGFLEKVYKTHCFSNCRNWGWPSMHKHPSRSIIVIKLSENTSPTYSSRLASSSN